jgi:heme exporter protein C
MASAPGNKSDIGFFAVTCLCAVAIVAAIHLVFFRAPTELTMGVVQKIFYFHVPAAYAMYLGAGACFLGSAAYFLSPTDRRDAIAKAGAQIAVLFGFVVLTTGPLWAAKAWGRYWTWDPRLTTSLLSVLIYVAYVILRSFAGDGEAEKKFAAALGVLGAANLPIIHYSVRKWSGQHPRVISQGGGGIAPEMVTALMAGFVAFTLLFVVLLWLKTRIELADTRLRHLSDEAAGRGIEEER